MLDVILFLYNICHDSGIEAEGYHSVRRVRIKPCKTLSVLTIFGSISEESCCMIMLAWSLKAFGLQSIHLSSLLGHDMSGMFMEELH